MQRAKNSSGLRHLRMLAHDIVTKPCTMKCYACEKTPYTSRYRLGGDGNCEYDSLDACQDALAIWRKQQRPGRMPYLMLLLYLLLH